MSAEIRVFRCLQDNIGALVHDPATGACAAIDAPEEAPILRALEETGWRLTDILVTHRHGDHVEAIETLKRRFGARVVAPGQGRLRRAGRGRRCGGGRHGAGRRPIRRRVGDPRSLRRSRGLLVEADHAVFAGDTLFTLGCGRVMEAGPDTMWASLTRLAALPDETRVYSGHDYVLSNARFALAADPDNAALKARAAEAEGAKAQNRFLVPSTIADEKATNPFLRAGEPALARSAGREGAGAAEVFAALREWKNRF
jgi:hydroxyacylglutathione hydrolase